MNRLFKVVAGVCVVAAMSACPPKPTGNCGGTECTSSERCDMDSLKCVADGAPVITLDSPPVVNTATFTVTGTITDDVQVTSAEWRTGTRPFTSIDLQSGGAFSFMVEAPLLDAENIVLTLRASDGKNETTLSRDVRVDRVGPAVELQSPDAGSAHNTASIAVALKVTDGSGAVSELTVNGQAVTSPMSGAVVMTSVAVPASANNTLIEVPVVAADSRGNRTMTSFSFYGDRIAPVVAVSAPVASDVIATPTMTVAFTANDPSALTATCSNTTGASAEAMSSDGTNWTCVLPVAMEERAETVSVVVSDAAGNTTTQMVTFAIDRVAPTVTVVSPLPGFIAGQPMTVTVNSSADADVAFARFGNGPTTTLGNGSSTWTGVITLPMHDFAAETLTIEVPDNVGNTTIVTVSGFTDTVAPVITFTAPMANRRFNIADLSGNTSVRTTWTFTDADPATTTTTINGVANTANQIDQPTSSTDNPQSYSTVIVVSDRAGNAVTETLSYSVDRVAPSIVSWTPAANSRLVDTAATLTLSESMTATQGLTVAQNPLLAGTWTTTSVYTLPLDTFAAQVIDLSVGALSDLHGNPLAIPASRKIHVATRLPGYTTIRSNVAQFAAASDGDGIAFIATIDTANTLDIYRDTGGAFVTVPRGTLPATASRVAVNAWNVVNPTTLASSTRYGLAAASTGVGGSVYALIDGVPTANSFATARLGVVSVPPFVGEISSSPVGLVQDNVFARAGGGSFTLPHNGALTVAQSSVSWNAFDSDSGHVYFSHFACRPLFGGGNECGGVSYGSATSNPTRLQGAITYSGSCAAMTWQSGAGTFANFLARPSCDTSPILCVGDTAIPAVTVTNDVRFATGGPSLPNSLLFSYRSAPNVLTVAQTNPGICDFFFANLYSITEAGAKEHLPIRIGTRTGLLFVTATNDLRLYVP
ncbi:MAG: hypothetical protein JNM17_29475 [Archangium sp.]|nr:hypothetical protein [Archangium sp.]